LPEFTLGSPILGTAFSCCQTTAYILGLAKAINSLNGTQIKKQRIIQSVAWEQLLGCSVLKILGLKNQVQPNERQAAEPDEKQYGEITNKQKVGPEAT
jgi:hypothetical protein